MGLLAWLGLKKEESYPNLDALLKELRLALPDDEAVVLRYIAIVIVLLGKVALADGRFSDKEEETLRSLLQHIGRIAPGGVDSVCDALQGKLPSVTEEELALCYRELKSLCDGKERTQVMRLLMQLAEVDGDPSTLENAELDRIANELGVSMTDVVASR